MAARQVIAYVTIGIMLAGAATAPGSHSDGGSAAGRGETLTVNWDGTGDFVTIQAALDAAADGDTVVVYPSSGSELQAYIENVVFPARAVTLRSLDPEDPAVVADTVIDGNHEGAALQFQPGTPKGAVLAGLTLRNGQGTSGGGIVCANADPLIRRCTITGCEASSGGGIFLSQSRATLEHCLILGNESSGNGGGIVCSASSPRIDGCTVSGNYAHYGGGVYCVGSSHAVLVNCVLSGNQAESYG